MLTYPVESLCNWLLIEIGGTVQSDGVEVDPVEMGFAGGGSTAGPESVCGPLLNLHTDRTVGDDSLSRQRHAAPYRSTIPIR